ncbi:hypothetical protein [Nocardia sp. NPDC057668]|uniref:helix-turn-helix transcriptional regulator n=1 Tax=Nocardia sp. NPDC057668 TaxID=3346202 RepID=UPI003671D87B
MRQHKAIAPGIVRLRPSADLNGDVRKLLSRVRSEAVLAISSPVRLPRHRGLGHTAVRDLMATGKQLRLLYSADYLDARDRRPLLEDASLGPTIRVAATDFHNTFIIDRHAAVLWSGAGARRPYMVMVRDAALIGALHQFATMTWESAVRPPLCPDSPLVSLDERTRSVLHTLDRGLTDEVAARELAMSVRTYRRHVADLMTRLEVSTRFQIGVHAARLGLLRPE